MFNSLVLLLASMLTTNGQYDESESLLNALSPPIFVKEADEYNYCRLTNNFAMNNKKAAELYGKQLVDSFTFKDMPRRRQALVNMMMYDLENWKSDDLSDIERDMRNVANRLDKAKGGKKTQDIQKEVVAKLDKLIKEQEDKNNAAAAAAAAEAAKNMLPGQGGQSTTPAPDTIIMGGSGAGKVDEKQLRKVAETWGTLPPAARAKVVQEITRDLPEKYRPMIEEYFKALNKMHGYDYRK